ncbi:calmodulin-2 [Thecamonas trahens ATCC 50062]|uniref:Calmodulin-2 n=1 Tax=Thecamonas trahens ATCC 50062 TaxID=461836 RepID=A0A0L0DMY4_THETB|nr:calmodulin-2 [Thecamonas trahens ATCC 50062]KNC53664.1 calmodulin-2 [Thecamonas trahens ATCC 50062]|eukprot:XP_013761979.1 calmodulin-2 [Thecamonas trahens ATCC 50062]
MSDETMTTRERPRHRAPDSSLSHSSSPHTHTHTPTYPYTHTPTHPHTMSTSLSQEEVALFKDVFSMVDKDADGSVSASELRGVMRKGKLSLDASVEEFEDMINEFDVDRAGTLDFPSSST